MSNSVETERPRDGSAPPAKVIESRQVIVDSYHDYLTDESRLGPASADRLAFPHCEEHIASALADAAERGGEVTLSAARTGIVGGAVPMAGTLLSLSEMNRILGVRRMTDGRLALRALPGVSIAELRDRLDRKDLGLAPSDVPTEDRETLESFSSGEQAYFYPPDPTEDTAHLGATVATNASGARSFSFGATRDHVVGLRVCLSCGEVLSLSRGAHIAADCAFTITTSSGERIELAVPRYDMPRTKSAAGYFAAPDMDLIDLFIGSEGTLGVITEVEVALAAKPEGILSALAFFAGDEGAIEFVRHARGDIVDQRATEGVAPIALEFFDSRSFEFLRARKGEEGSSSEIPELPEGARAGVLFEQDYAEDDLVTIYDAWEELLAAHGSSMEQTWGGMDEADLARLKALRHGIAEQVNMAIAAAKAEHPDIHKVGTDIAVPADALTEMFRFYENELEGTGLRYVIFGHVGDSHLHLNIMPNDPYELRVAKELALRFAGRAVELGGTVSAEHGIGKLKHDFLRIMYGDAGLAEMVAVKKALDPAGVLNRGVMFPEELL